MIKQAEIKRNKKNMIEIQWVTERENQTISIFSGESPETINHESPLAVVKNKNLFQFPAPESGDRLYFELKPDHGRGLILAERRVPLQGAVNFRDLGGYRAEDGRSIKWGRIFRSDNLSRLTDRDIATLKSLNLKLVCDLRTENEAQKSPDRLPEGKIEYLNLPVNHDRFDFQVGLKKMKAGDDSWMTKEFMIDGYIQNLDEFPEVWATLFKKLVEPESRPLLFHCTGGKDRAGTCAALILLVLGVPEKTVIHDHQLSNIFIADIMDDINARIRNYGIDPEKLKSYFSAPREAIMALLDHLNKQYGSARNYLIKKAGLDKGVLSVLQEQLLH